MDFGLLLLRVFVGLQVASHGAQKLFGLFGGHGIAGTGGFFAQLGFTPGRFFAVCAGLAELGGGLLFALGFLTPLGAAAIVAVMLTAVWSVHLEKGFFVDRGGYELPLLLAVIAVSVAFSGPGRFSLDRALDWQWAGARAGLLAIILGGLGSAAAWAGRAATQRSEQRAHA